MAGDEKFRGRGGHRAADAEAARAVERGWRVRAAESRLGVLQGGDGVGVEGGSTGWRGCRNGEALAAQRLLTRTYGRSPWLR